MTLQTNLKVAVLLLLCTGAASAQMYKWKDAAGVTHFSDTPPPAAAKVEAKSFSGSAGGDVSTAGMPYELAQAVKNFPVTLYTTAGCGACDQARAMLNQRGVPFTEKTVTGNADQAAFRKAGGGNELPMMLVGRSKLVGYDSGTWGGALTSANYPAQRALPANYQNARVTTAAPQVQAQPVGNQNDGAAAAAAAQNALRDKPAPVNAPPGFQF